MQKAQRGAGLYVLQSFLGAGAAGGALGGWAGNTFLVLSGLTFIPSLTCLRS